MAFDKSISAALEYLCRHMCEEIPERIDEKGGYKSYRLGCKLPQKCIAFLDFKRLDQAEYTVMATICRSGFDFSVFLKSGSVEEIINYLNSEAGVSEIILSMERLCEKSKRYCNERNIED